MMPVPVHSKHELAGSIGSSSAAAGPAAAAAAQQAGMTITICLLVMLTSCCGCSSAGCSRPSSRRAAVGHGQEQGISHVSYRSAPNHMASDEAAVAHLGRLLAQAGGRSPSRTLLAPPARSTAPQLDLTHHARAGQDGRMHQVSALTLKGAVHLLETLLMLRVWTTTEHSGEGGAGKGADLEVGNPNTQKLGKKLRPNWQPCLPFAHASDQSLRGQKPSNNRWLAQVSVGGCD
jgi:hypothetical protein